MGTRKPSRHEYAVRTAVRLVAEPKAHRYLPPYLGQLRRRHFMQPCNVVTFVFVEDLADAYRLVPSCLQLRLIGATAHDFPVPPAEIGGEHSSVRIVIAAEGKKDDPENRKTSDYLARVTYRYAVAPGLLSASNTRIVRMHLPTLRDAVDLVRACPHLRLVAEEWRGSLR